jgi:hypothetical protein
LRDEVHVLFENRTRPVREQAFADRFEPYGVHVYGTVPDLLGGPK